MALECISIDKLSKMLAIVSRPQWDKALIADGLTLHVMVTTRQLVMISVSHIRTNMNVVKSMNRTIFRNIGDNLFHIYIYIKYI